MRDSNFSNSSFLKSPNSSELSKGVREFRAESSSELLGSSMSSGVKVGGLKVGHKIKSADQDNYIDFLKLLLIYEIGIIK